MKTNGKIENGWGSAGPERATMGRRQTKEKWGAELILDFWFKGLVSKSRDLNIFKPNLN
jgi:hypothetical protein